MTSPPRSQPGIDDLIKMLDLHVDGVRHYLHLQIGKPLSKDLISAPEIALDNLHREMKGALRAQCGVLSEVPAVPSSNCFSNAYNEGFGEGMREHSSSKGGWPWSSRKQKYSALLDKALALSSANRGGE